MIQEPKEELARNEGNSFTFSDGDTQILVYHVIFIHLCSKVLNNNLTNKLKGDCMNKR